MIHTAELDLDRFPEVELEFDVFSYFYDHGYPVDITELHSVVNQKPQDEDSGYLVAKITTTEVPLDEADVATDEISMYACSCPAFQFQEVPDLKETTITDCGQCKHLRSVDPVAKAKADENQTEL